MLRQDKQHNGIDGNAARPGDRGTFNPTDLDQIKQGREIDRQFKEMKLRGKVRSSDALHNGERRRRQTVDENSDREPLENAGAVYRKFRSQPQSKTVVR